jgi:Divergent InlB B-repeat domain
MARGRSVRRTQHDAGRRFSRSVRLALYVVAAAAIGLALPLGSGTAARTAPTAPAAAAAIACNGDNLRCLSINISGSGSVTVHDCTPIITIVAASGSCPSGYGDRTGNGYPTTCTSSCSNLGIIQGDIVVLGATANSGWNFSSWSGSCSGTADTCSFTMPSKASVTATFVVATHTLRATISPSGGGTVTDDGGQISCPSDCSGTYSDGSSVTLSATPNSGYRFSGWSDACSGSGDCTVTMDADKSVTANFVKVWTLTVSVVSGSGSVSSSPGGTCSSSCSGNYDNGTPVTLTATPASGYRFGGWGGGSCSGTGSCTVTMNADRTVTATFVKVWSLTIVVSGSGNVGYSASAGASGTCTSTCVIPYDAGTVVTLTEHPGANAFVGWGGDCQSAGTQSTCTLTMDNDKFTSAGFGTAPAPPPPPPSPPPPPPPPGGGNVTGLYHLTVGVVGRGRVRASGGVDCSTAALFSAQAGCSGDYDKGASVNLVAVPDSGYTFQYWGGACAPYGALETCTVTMDASKNVSATFVATPVIGDEPPCSAVPAGVPCEANQLPKPEKGLLVSISGADGGRVTGGPAGAQAFALSHAASGSISCGGNSYVCYDAYAPGQTISLQATPAKGFNFRGWSGACTGKASKCTVKVNDASKVKATFAPTSGRTRTLSMQTPKFRVRWVQSTGQGKLIVSGRIGGAARLTLDLRRPGAASLVKLRKTVSRSGAFRFVKKLPATFAHGAKLFPGGKVISLRGTASGYYVPMQVQTVSLRGPREGVVRRSFTSAAQASSAKPRLPASATVAWANFRFEQQPAAGSPLFVDWYYPGGQGRLGSVQKANRPTVSSFIRSGHPLPSGCWQAVLRVGGNKDGGGKRVKTQLVGIGKSCRG